MKIPFFIYPGLYAEHEEEFLALIDDVLLIGANARKQRPCFAAGRTPW